MTNSSPENFERNPYAVQLFDGRFVNAFTSEAGTGPSSNGTDIWLRITNVNALSQDGPVQRETLVFSGADNQIQPVVAANLNGNFAVAWLDLAGDNAIRFKEYNTNGSELRSLTISLIPYAISTSIDYDSISLIGTADGGFMMSYSDTALQGHIALINGSTVTDIALPGSGSQLWPQLFELADGRIATVYFGSGNARFAVFNTDGTASVAATTLGASSSDFGAGATGTALLDGRMMFVWKAANGELVGRVYAADGAADGEAFSVNQVTTGLQGNLSIDTLADGRVAIAWETDETGFGAVKYAIFDPRETGQSLVGTTDSDDFVGTGFEDSFHMGYGDDKVDGSGGNDRMEGGFGDDRLDGGAGTDTAIGGFGNDTYTVDDSRDVIVETAGQGQDTVIARVSYTLGAGISIEELIVRSSANNLRLTGNELDQILTGDFRANILDGGAGSDTLRGNEGNDTYFVDDFDDKVEEASGNGTLDTINTRVSFALAAGSEIERLLANPTSGTSALALVGNDLAQTVQGNAGSNRLTGRGGADTLTGLAGDDRFIFANAGETRPGVQRDTITDFEDVGDDDTIHLAGFAGTLTFIGQQAFSGLNQIRAIQSGNHVMIQINNEGSAAADAEIRLLNTTLSQITASDFVL